MAKDFVVKESNFSARVKKRWRFPRGKHSAVRQMHRGRPALPSLGYGAPSSVKYKINGLKPVDVKNKAQLLLVGKEEIAVLSSTLGGKKKLALLSLALEKKITVFGHVDKVKEKIESAFATRKKIKNDRNVKKASKKTVAKEKPKDKVQKETPKSKEKSEKDVSEGLDETLSKEEEKQKEQKKMVEQTLTKRQ